MVLFQLFFKLGGGGIEGGNFSLRGILGNAKEKTSGREREREPILSPLTQKIHKKFRPIPLKNEDFLNTVFPPPHQGPFTPSKPKKGNRPFPPRFHVSGVAGPFGECMPNPFNFSLSARGSGFLPFASLLFSLIRGTPWIIRGSRMRRSSSFAGTRVTTVR